MASKKTPPKFAIANRFVIGSFPQEIKFFNKDGQRVTRKVEDDELADTLKIQWFVDERNSTSPAAEKKQKQHLIISQEKKDAQREKERLSKNAKCCTETQEECAKCKKTGRDCKTTKRQIETSDQAAKCKKTMCTRYYRQQQTETEEQAAKCKKNKWDRTRRKSKEMRHQAQNNNRGCNRYDMTNVIDHATKEAKQYLHRTQDPAKPHQHRATVCIICDHFIIGTETIHKLTKEDIGAHSERLGVKSYEEY